MRIMKPANSSPTISKSVVAAKEPDKEEAPLSPPSPSGRTSLLSIFRSSDPGSGRRRVRLGSEDELARKNRRIVDNYLRRVGALLDKEISFNDNGVAYYSYRRFVIVIEVPQDNPGMVFIYTMVCQLKASDNQQAVLKLAMEMNYLQCATRGSTLGLDGEEVNLCMSVPVQGLSFADMRTALQSFMLTSVEANQKLDEAKTSNARTVSWNS